MFNNMHQNNFHSSPSITLSCMGFYVSNGVDTKVNVGNIGVHLVKFRLLLQDSFSSNLVSVSGLLMKRYLYCKNKSVKNNLRALNDCLCWSIWCPPHVMLLTLNCIWNIFITAAQADS